MIGAAKDKSSLPGSLTALRVLLCLLITFLLAGTRAEAFFAPPDQAPGQIAAFQPDSTGKTTTAWQYDALDSLIAANSAMISSPGGGLRAIAAGSADLSSYQASVLARLEGYGSSAIIPKRGFGLNDLAALSAKTGDEFAMFTTGGRRMIMRGDATTVPISLEQAKGLSAQGWRWSAHTHPDGVLRSSGLDGDRGILAPFRNQRSAILDPFGGRSLFSPAGDMLDSSWLPR
jgi:hypothetical protein